MMTPLNTAGKVIDNGNTIRVLPDKWTLALLSGILITAVTVAGFFAQWAWHANAHIETIVDIHTLLEKIDDNVDVIDNRVTRLEEWRTINDEWTRSMRRANPKMNIPPVLPNRREDGN